MIHLIKYFTKDEWTQDRDKLVDVMFKARKRDGIPLKDYGGHVKIIEQGRRDGTPLKDYGGHTKVIELTNEVA